MEPPAREPRAPAAATDEQRDSAADEAATLADPKFLQILSTEHWSLLTARSLAYNEAFTRASMLLTFVSMSFVGLALLAQASGFAGDFLLVATVVLAFDLVIAIVTFIRVGTANREETTAVHGMNRIRHGYVEIVPPVARYFITGTTDDEAGIMRSYGGGPVERSTWSDIAYGLSTSLGLVALVLAMLAGLLAGVIALGAGASTILAIIAGAVAAVLALLIAVGWAFRSAMAFLSSLETHFPSSETNARD